MRSCFLELPIQSCISGDLLVMMSQARREEWFPYYNFMALQAPDDLINQEPLFREMRKLYSFRGGIIKVASNACYNWHRDSVRQTTINMLLLDDGGSHCVFAPEKFDIVMPVTELKYRPDAYYVFNTQIPHLILNFTQPRYLFGLEFTDESTNLSYQDLCADIEGLIYGHR